MTKLSDYKLPVKKPSRNYPGVRSAQLPMVKDTDKDGA